MAKVTVQGLKEFRRALKASQDANPRELTKALKVAGAPVVSQARSLAGAASRTGAHAGGFSARAAGAKGSIVNRVPYAGGAEWGARGRWSGFNRYGGRGSRFAGRAVDDKADEVQRIITEELREIITAQGWAT